MRKRMLFTAGAALVMTIGSGTAAFASDGLVTTPTEKVGNHGTACVFIGASTVGDPLVGQPIFKGDPKTGVYTSCPV